MANMLDKIFELMIEKAHETALKWHALIGFAVGTGPVAYLMNHWQDAIGAVILGFLTGLGSSLWKIIADYLATRKKRKK